MSYVVALTGGIGSGKSLVANLFSQYHVPIIDADEIAKSLSQPGQIAYNEILSHFGEKVLLNNQQLNRTKLREIIFHDSQQRQWLEHCLHPKIFAKIKRQVQAVKAPYCLVVIPLLSENFKKYQNIIDHVIVIDLDDSLRFERLLARDKQSPELLLKMMAAQATRQQRADIADTLLDNSGTVEQMSEQILRLHEKFSKQKR